MIITSKFKNDFCVSDYKVTIKIGNSMGFLLKPTY